VVGHERAELVWSIGEHQEDVGNEAGFFLHFEKSCWPRLKTRAPGCGGAFHAHSGRRIERKGHYRARAGKPRQAGLVDRLKQKIPRRGERHWCWSPTSTLRTLARG
jgi:hypothetical protein